MLNPVRLLRRPPASSQPVESVVAHYKNSQIQDPQKLSDKAIAIRCPGEMMSTNPSRLIVLAVAILFLQACASPPTPEPTRAPTHTATDAPTATNTATKTPTNTATFTPSPTATFTASPTNTPTATPTATETPTPTPVVGLPEGIILRYFTHIGTNGPIACGDSLVGYSTGFVRTGDVETDVQIGLNSLFGSGGPWFGGLFNAIYPSNLRVLSVDYKKSSDTVTIYTTGNFVKPPEDCDRLRFRGQVWATARQFPEVKKAIIWWNDSLLGDHLWVANQNGNKNP